MVKEKHTIDDINDNTIALWIQYCNAYKQKLEEDAKKMVDSLNEQLKKEQETQQKLKMMFEHPEWFKVTSPKEYGMNLKKRKYGNCRKH